MVFSLVNQKSSCTCFSSLQRKQTPRTASDNPQLFAQPSSRVCPKLARHHHAQLICLLRRTRGPPFLARTVVAKSPPDMPEANRRESANDAEPFTICFRSSSRVPLTRWSSDRDEQEPTATR